jgi:NhaA family Na+:H+ antiporter
VKLGIAALPTGVNWKQLLGVGFLGGIGFTMALFIGNLAFTDPHQLEAAKMGIMLASVASTLLGVGLLLTCQTESDTVKAGAPEPSAA